jgi:hypothetical protein
MAKFLGLWRFNPIAPMPTDPIEVEKMLETMFAAMDNLIKTGEVLEFGFFPEATSGYAITSGGSTGQFRGSFSFYPFVGIEVHEIVPYEKGKEIMRGVLKAQAEAMKR